MKKVTYQRVAHVQDGNRHAVAASLRVLIRPADAGGYVAQGLDIDYVATGGSVDEVKQIFAEGLVRTIRSLIRRGRPLSALFKGKAPQEAWQAYIDHGAGDELLCGTFMDLREKLPADARFPFTALEYCETPETCHA